MKFLFFFLLVSLSGFASKERDWERWDDENVTKIIDDYWLATEEEIAHRKTLAALTQILLFPGDHFLEIGCGSGLIYEQLVPHVIDNRHYTGIDISEKMLALAQDRYPLGVFLKGDAYALSFPDNAFELVAAYEVIGHIKQIDKVIQEMYRVASRQVVFTVWTAPRSVVTNEIINNSTFLHQAFAHEDVLALIEIAIKQPHTVITLPLSGGKSAYIIRKI